MHQNNQKVKQDECLICFQPLLKDVSILHMITNIPICNQCIAQFEIIHWDIDFYHHPLHILYNYNDFFKSLLFQYKGQYDYALKDTFLCLFQDELKKKYKDHIIVVAPSSLEDNLKRGFAPIESIAKTIFNHVFVGLYKKEKYKQSDLRYEERKMVMDKIGIRNGEVLKGKKVLIIDDVLTSGSTLLTCLSLVSMQNPKSIELLVLSTKKKKEELVFEMEG